MTLKQRHRTAEIATNDTKTGRNWDSDNENHNRNIPTATWPPRQCAKQQVLKFRPKRASWKSHSVFRYTTLSDKGEFNSIPTIPKKNKTMLVVSGSKRRLQVPSIGWRNAVSCCDVIKSHTLSEVSWAVLIPQNFCSTCPKYKSQNNKLTGINLQFRLNHIFEIKST